MTSDEKIHVKLVTSFLRDLGGAKMDGARLGSYFADDCELRMSEEKPRMIGKAAAVGAFDSAMTKGVRYEERILGIFAKGPVVAAYHDDLAVIDGKPGRKRKLVSLFVLRDSKIKEWAHYVLQNG